MYTKLYNGMICKQITLTETVTFPEDPQNELYIEYQEWVDEGNLPLYLPSPQEALQMIEEAQNSDQ